MEDREIVELYWQRSESAIAETERKYGAYCRYIARNILLDREDSEECVNDAYLGVWNSIPTKRPQVLKSYIGRITRNIALNRFSRPPPSGISARCPWLWRSWGTASPPGTAATGWKTT